MVSLSVCLSVCLSARLSVYPSLSVGVCVIVVVLTDRESGTRPVFTRPGSMEAGEYGLTRGTCLVARRLGMVAVAWLLWILCCVLGRVNILVSSFRFFISWNAHGLLQVRGRFASCTTVLVPCLWTASMLVAGQG